MSDRRSPNRANPIRACLRSPNFNLHSFWLHTQSRPVSALVFPWLWIQLIHSIAPCSVHSSRTHSFRRALQIFTCAPTDPFPGPISIKSSSEWLAGWSWSKWWACFCNLHRQILKVGLGPDVELVFRQSQSLDLLYSLDNRADLDYHVVVSCSCPICGGLCRVPGLALLSSALPAPPTGKGPELCASGPRRIGLFWNPGIHSVESGR